MDAMPRHLGSAPLAHSWRADGAWPKLQRALDRSESTSAPIFVKLPISSCQRNIAPTGISYTHHYAILLA